MARGPLPQAETRRRNAPTIPTTALPVGGREGPAPRVPANVLLSKAGKAWWRWAWSTPQAAAWDSGSVQLVARRASLEDDLATVGEVASLDAFEALDALGETAGAFKVLVVRLAGLATGRLAIIREMRETDKLLGLSPRALSELRWKIVDDAADEDGGKPRLRVVDAAPGAADPRSLLA